MDRTYKIGLIAAVIYIVFELAIVFLGYSHNENVHVFAFGVNTFTLLVAVAYSVLSEFNIQRAKGKGVSLLHDIKSGLRTVSVYAVIISMFIFSYYNWIDPEYPAIRRQQHLERTLNKNFEEQAKLKMAAAPEMYEGKSIEDLRDENQAGIETYLQPSFKSIVSITLFSLILLGMLYTFVITGLNRLVLAKLF